MRCFGSGSPPRSLRMVSGRATNASGQAPKTWLHSSAIVRLKGGSPEPNVQQPPGRVSAWNRPSPGHGFLHSFPSLRRSEEHTSELQSQFHLVCRLLLEKKKKPKISINIDQKKKHPPLI